jgi:hypothetical protein
MPAICPESSPRGSRCRKRESRGCEADQSRSQDNTVQPHNSLRQRAPARNSSVASFAKSLRKDPSPSADQESTPPPGSQRLASLLRIAAAPRTICGSGERRKANHISVATRPARFSPDSHGTSVPPEARAGACRLRGNINQYRSRAMAAAPVAAALAGTRARSAVPTCGQRRASGFAASREFNKYCAGAPSRAHVEGFESLPCSRARPLDCACSQGGDVPAAARWVTRGMPSSGPHRSVGEFS